MVILQLDENFLDSILDNINLILTNLNFNFKVFILFITCDSLSNCISWIEYKAIIDI